MLPSVPYSVEQSYISMDCPTFCRLRLGNVSYIQIPILWREYGANTLVKLQNKKFVTDLKTLKTPQWKPCLRTALKLCTFLVPKL